MPPYQGVPALASLDAQLPQALPHQPPAQSCTEPQMSPGKQQLHTVLAGCSWQTDGGFEHHCRLQQTELEKQWVTACPCFGHHPGAPTSSSQHCTLQPDLHEATAPPDLATQPQQATVRPAAAIAPPSSQSNAQRSPPDLAATPQQATVCTLMTHLSWPPPRRHPGQLCSSPLQPHRRLPAHSWLGRCPHPRPA